MNTLVRHVASRNDWAKPKDDSDAWRDYWYQHSSYEYPTVCPDCHRRIWRSNDLVGAHVKKVYSSDEKIYIVPTCRECNSKGASDYHMFECPEEYLVPANKNNL